MFEQIYKTYGLKINILAEKQLSGIPIYMAAGRKIYEAECEGQKFLIVGISAADKFGSVALEKQMGLYQNVSNMPMAYLFDKMTAAQRAALIKRQIPFISEPEQLFLPFLGIALRNSLKNRAEVKTEKMMPATQSLFLHLLYRGQSGCLKKDAAEYLGLTRTSISRASEQLKAMGFIREERNGKEIIMQPAEGGEALFNMAKPYLINPVQRKIYVKHDVAAGWMLAGESALAEMTMLNPPKIPVYAVVKDSDELKQIETADPKWETDEKICVIELWKYDPSRHADGDTVDPVSLAMSFEQQNDERIEGAIEEYLESWKW